MENGDGSRGWRGPLHEPYVSCENFNSRGGADVEMDPPNLSSKASSSSLSATLASSASPGATVEESFSPNASHNHSLDIWGRVPPKDPTVIVYLPKSSSGSSSHSYSSSHPSLVKSSPCGLTYLQKTSVECCKCNRKVGGGRFVAHLEKCMGLNSPRTSKGKG